MRTQIIHGNSLVVLPTFDDNSVDAIVTDPPYELGFMGKSWDASGIAYNVELWREALRVLKPGGHLLAFGGSRTYHRLACAIEDAGFEIRDQIMWVYGSGFPKSLDVSKAIDKAAGAERVVVGSRPLTGNGKTMRSGFHQPDGSGAGETVKQDVFEFTVPATSEAKQWDGWGTALKPAHEPIVVARKPLEGTVAANVLKWGTGALNIDGTRVDMGDEYDPTKIQRQQNSAGAIDGAFGASALIGKEIQTYKPGGRWPANFIHDGSDEVLALFPETGKSTGGRIGKKSMGAVTNVPAGQYEAGDPGYGDSGSAARFFYCAKAGKKERNAGLGHLPERQGGGMSGTADKSLKTGSGNERDGTAQNHHPTVKPIALMRYLIRLVTPPGGVVLDPFAGSGTTLVAATLENMSSIGIEMTDDYLPIIDGRVAWAKENKETDTLF